MNVHRPVVSASCFVAEEHSLPATKTPTKKEKMAIDNWYCDFLAKLQKLLVEITGPQMKISVSLSFIFHA
jgi:hypothetical protein